MSMWQTTAITVCVVLLVLMASMLVKTAIDLGAERAENAWLHRILDYVLETRLSHTATSKRKADE